MDNINQPFQPEPIEAQKERFQECLNKSLCLFHYKTEELTIFDTEDGFRVFIGVFTNIRHQTWATPKILYVLAKQIEGDSAPWLLNVTKIASFITMLSNQQFQDGIDAQEDEHGNLIIRYEINKS